MDNRSTTNYLRYQFGALDTYIYECGNDILKLNQYVQELELSLKARGEKAEYLNLNLFTGYEAWSDEKFRQYISKKRDDYEDGTNPNLTPKQLMTYAENKFNTIKRDHKWNSLSPDQEKVVALSTTVRELQDTNLKLATAFKSQSKKSNKKGRSNTDKWAWKKDPPKDSDPKTKQFNHKTYHWCHKHQMWTLHKPSECKLKQATAAKNVDLVHVYFFEYKMYQAT